MVSIDELNSVKALGVGFSGPLLTAKGWSRFNLLFVLTVCAFCSRQTVEAQTNGCSDRLDCESAWIGISSEEKALFMSLLRVTKILLMGLVPS